MEMYGCFESMEEFVKILFWTSCHLPTLHGKKIS